MAFDAPETPPHSRSPRGTQEYDESSASHEWTAFRIRPGMTRDEIDHVSSMVANLPSIPDLAMATDTNSSPDLTSYSVQELVEIHKQQIIQRFVNRYSKRKTGENAGEESASDSSVAPRWAPVFETL